MIDRAVLDGALVRVRDVTMACEHEATASALAALDDGISPDALAAFCAEFGTDFAVEGMGSLIMRRPLPELVRELVASALVMGVHVGVVAARIADE